MKHNPKVISGVCIAALAFGLPLTTSAAGKKSASAIPEASTSSSTAMAVPGSVKAIPYHGMIASVDQTTKTFSIAGKKAPRVFKITDRTKIVKDGNPGTMSDLVEKQEVRGSYWKGADGSLEAKTVKLGTKAGKKDTTTSPAPSGTP